MRIGLKVAQLTLFDILEYRTELFFHIIRYSLNIGLYAVLWIGVNEASSTQISTQSLITYFAWSSVFYSFSNFHLDHIISDIRRGEINKFALKPYQPFNFYFWFQSTHISIDFCIRFCMSVALLFSIGLTALPNGVAGFLLGTLTAVCAFYFMFCMSFALCGLSFWIQTAESLRMTFLFISRFLSGLFIPALFIPSFISELLEYTPFPHLAATPISFFTSGVSATNIAGLCTLAGWCIFAFLLQKTIWHFGLKRSDAVGS